MKRLAVLCSLFLFVGGVIGHQFVGGSGEVIAKDTGARSPVPRVRIDAAINKSPSSCTGAMALGLTSAKGNLVGRSIDWISPIYNGIYEGAVKLIEEEGNRYLEIGGWPVVNEKGVSTEEFGRGARGIPYPNEPAPRMTDAQLLKQSDSAAEYVKLYTESLHKYGTGHAWFGWGRMVMDAKEGYLVESADICYDCDENHAVQGPMTDTVFGSANFYVAARLRAHESGGGAGYTRARKVWKLLVEHQYGSTPSYSGMTLPYFMSIFRDHGALTPEEARMSSYTPETMRPDAVCCHGSITQTFSAQVVNPEFTDTGLLSCAWVTQSKPCSSPYLPFYVGITEVPEEFSTTTASEIFDDLRLALEYHPEYREKITYYWTVFELQTIEETLPLEVKVFTLAKDKKVDEARKLLTEFVKLKCDKALAAAKAMLGELESLPICVERPEKIKK